MRALLAPPPDRDHGRRIADREPVRSSMRSPTTATTFAEALGAAPIWILAVAVVLHGVWLAARARPGAVCVQAAGGSIDRRRLYRAARSATWVTSSTATLGLGGPHRRPAAFGARDEPEGLRPALGRDPDRGRRGRARGVMLLHPGRPPRPALVDAAGRLRRDAASARVLQRVAATAAGDLGGARDPARLEGRAGSSPCRARGRDPDRPQLVPVNGAGVDASILDSIALLIGFAVFGLLPVGPSGGAAATALILGPVASPPRPRPARC